MEPVYTSLRLKDEDESILMFHTIAAEKVSARRGALANAPGAAGGNSWAWPPGAPFGPARTPPGPHGACDGAHRYAVRRRALKTHVSPTRPAFATGGRPVPGSPAPHLPPTPPPPPPPPAQVEKTWGEPKGYEHLDQVFQRRGKSEPMFMVYRNGNLLSCVRGINTPQVVKAVEGNWPMGAEDDVEQNGILLKKKEREQPEGADTGGRRRRR